ncbi:HNH endonuclease signature motif containing protein [Salicibibacter kimchii]|uniref:HNH endonuclease n=1 Tax=Salicibibacter kimchii TaxID=2099786 RepID=A0A345BUH1_9BACI|nr:HNH endonuclease signature motif containing protein [Salicibibacter kimchii]AXF54602.1 HNH endonuclease [Salicibibacter kimchii]
MHRYTKEQVDYIRSIAPGRFIKDIHNKFVEKYNADVSDKSVQNIMHRHGIKNKLQGYHTRKKKGDTAWNKGMKGLQLGGEKGWFPKGNQPPSYLPVGSESLHEGVLMIKTDDPNVWEKKHRWLWKQHYGEVPDGKAVTFKDGDKQNVTIDNLFLTNQVACMHVAIHGLPQNSPDLNVASHRLSELKSVVRQKEGQEG